MGTAVADMPFVRPDPRSRDWEAYRMNVARFREVECRAATHDTDIHVAADGDDLDDGSISTPKATVAGALAIATANDRILVKRGDTIRETGSIGGSSLAGLYAGTYGDSGKRPEILGPGEDIASGVTWNLESTNGGNSTKTWYVDDAGPTNYYFRLFQWVNGRIVRPNRYTSLAGTKGQINSFYHDHTTNGRLYVTIDDADDPTNYDWQAFESGYDGLELSGNQAMYEDLVFRGFNAGTQGCGIRIATNGTDVAVAVNCEDTDFSTHGCHFNGGGSASDAGGFAAFIGCVAGFGDQRNSTESSAGDTGISAENVFNSYVHDGGQQTDYYNCEVSGGTVRVNGTARKGRAVGAHTNNTVNPVGECHFCRLRVRAGAQSVAVFNGLQGDDTVGTDLTDGNLKDAYLTITDVALGPAFWEEDAEPLILHTLALNHHQCLMLRCTGRMGCDAQNTTGALGFSNRGYGGWHLFHIDWGADGETANTTALVNPDPSNTLTLKLDGCTAVQTHSDTQTFARMFNYDRTSNWGAARLRNCFFATDPASQGNNHFWDTSGGAATFEDVVIFGATLSAALESGVTEADVYLPGHLPPGRNDARWRAGDNVGVFRCADVFGNPWAGSVGAVEDPYGLRYDRPIPRNAAGVPLSVVN